MGPYVILAILSTIFAGCGGGMRLAPEPSGSFSNANLSGSYAFGLAGTNSFGTFSAAGNLTADGNGSITAGTLDFNSGGGIFNNAPVLGSYSVSADGRGTATLNSTNVSLQLDFVIISSHHALVTRFENIATASGFMDLQDASAFTAPALQGNYVFNFNGLDVNGNPLQTVGSMTLSGGTITGGVQDINDGGNIGSSLPLSGTYSVAANGRGALALNTTLGTLNFAFYVVNDNQLRFVELDNGPVLAGDAFSQPAATGNTSLNGAYAFTLGGGLNTAIVAGGVFTADGNGTISSGIEDFNNNGSLAQNLASNGSYAIAANGRGTLSLNNSNANYQFVIYPSSGGVQMLEIDSNVLSGTAFAATPTGTISGSYGFNLTGINSNGEVDDIAQFTASSGSLTGALDVNNAGNFAQGIALSGTYSAPINGRGTAAFKNSAGNINAIYYVVNSSQVIFIETDGSQIALGEFEQQQP